MSTLRNHFIPLVDDWARRCHDDEELFCAAQVASALPTSERRRRCRYFPRYIVFFPGVLKFPDQFRELGIRRIFSIFEVFCVVIVPFLEGRLADTEVTGVTTWFADSCLVYNTALEALSVQRTVFLDPTITQSFLSTRLCLLLLGPDLRRWALSLVPH